MAMERREFLKTIAGMGSLAALGSISQLPFLKQAQAAAPAFSDYKAMVCIFLYGGNDAFNMLVPLGSDPGKGYTNYADIRNDLAVQNRDLDLATVTTNQGNLNQGILGSGSANPYNQNLNQASAYTRGHYPLTAKGIDLGVNGVMPELAQLIHNNRVSILANTGTLIKPVTRSEIKAGNVALPKFLFAHNHQQRELQTGRADSLGDIGWAGRIADNWSNINGSNPLGLNVSYFGNNRMMIGRSTSPLVIKTGAPPNIAHLKEGIGNSSDDRRVLFKALAGIQGSTSRLNFDATNTVDTSDPYRRLYNRLLLKSLSTFDQLNDSWKASQINFSTTGPYGEALFDIPTHQQLGFSDSINGQLIEQLAAVAQMIHLGATGALGPGYNRQIFLVQLGGFDTHSSQAATHPLLLRELSLGLWKFQKAMEELGYAKQVTTFTLSDFGRTLSRNGDGTDHAWGSHQLVMGGLGDGSAASLDGGKLFGTLPDLHLDGDDDYNDKGRIIPTMAQDQVNAAIVRWFGVDDSLMQSLFPNLVHFQTNGNFDSAYVDLFA
ncbi:MAG: DUF1501 domain-containing protein [Candidatus Thiodiazotropha sp. (ex Lucinoma annulata)]|nr:DUF1501 domain-containing protein [Candidatus Thiodiazotropha sp. (ex Lucinoma annulata)]